MRDGRKQAEWNERFLRLRCFDGVGLGGGDGLRWLAVRSRRSDLVSLVSCFVFLLRVSTLLLGLEDRLGLSLDFGLGIPVGSSLLVLLLDLLPSLGRRSGVDRESKRRRGDDAVERHDGENGSKGVRMAT
jgi:hypothetical protein